MGLLLCIVSGCSEASLTQPEPDPAYQGATLTILEPEPEVGYSSTERIAFRSAFTGANGQNLALDKMAWTSNHDGVVGQQRNFSTDRLSTNTHQVILKVEYEDGSMESSTVVRVEEQEPIPLWSQFEFINQSESWFDVYRIQEDLYAIYEPGQAEHVLAHLIVGTEKALLFDTGLGVGDIKSVVSQLTDREVIVLNSHTHYDHMGGNYQFDVIYGRDTEFTRINAQGKTNSEVSMFVPPGSFTRPTPEGFDPAAYHVKPFTITHVVQNHEVIDLGGRELEVLFTPGHTPDALCLLDRDRQLLFTGDTFYVGPLYAMLPESDLEAYLATAQTLLTVRNATEHLMTGHNRTQVDDLFLDKMYRGFRAIAQETATAEPVSGGRYQYYAFEGFGILVPGEAGSQRHAASRFASRQFSIDR